MGLVGPNGAGKTTLFSILLGEQEEDEGEIEWERNVRIGYLPQESAPTGEETVLELATAIDQQLLRHSKSLREHPDEEDPETSGSAGKVCGNGRLHPRGQGQKDAFRLSFHVDDFNKPAKTLSGGWVMRAHLARLLVMEPDLLMLDEPTNHLDLETLGWFQEQMRSSFQVQY